MRRFACFAIAALACTSAAAQNYSGTFTTTNQQGGTVTLVLKQDAQSNVKGTLTGNNNTFQVAAQATPQGLMGTVSGQQGNLYLMAQYEGASLVVILAEPGPNGQANLQSARHLSQDGMNWAPQQLQVTQNSNGYPIIKSGGKEYMQCN